MKLITLLLIFACNLAYSQESKILERLQALGNNGKIWYNIDGIVLQVKILNVILMKKGLKKYSKSTQSKIIQE